MPGLTGRPFPPWHAPHISNLALNAREVVGSGAVPACSAVYAGAASATAKMRAPKMVGRRLLLMLKAALVRVPGVTPRTRWNNLNNAAVRLVPQGAGQPASAPLLRICGHSGALTKPRKSTGGRGGPSARRCLNHEVGGHLVGRDSLRVVGDEFSLRAHEIDVARMIDRVAQRRPSVDMRAVIDA